jgi:hypothetical protein
MTLEELSWFVDDTVKRELCRACAACRPVERNGGVAARSASPSIPTG